MSTTRSVPLHTTPSPPRAEQLGLVRYWASNTELATAEATALKGLQEQAAAAGAIAVVDVRVEITPQLHLSSRSPLLGRLVYMDSTTTWLVYTYGTAINATDT